MALSTSVKRTARGGRGDDAHEEGGGDDAPERVTSPMRGGGATANGAGAAGGAAAAQPPAEASISGSGGGGEDLGSYTRQLRTWAITYSGIRDPHVMRWALPLTAPCRLALSLTMVRLDCMLRVLASLTPPLRRLTRRRAWCRPCTWR